MTIRMRQSIYVFEVAVDQEGITIRFPKRVATPPLTSEQARLLARMLRAAADQNDKVPS